MHNHNAILAEPLQPTWDRRCEKCGERRALQCITSRDDPVAGRIDTYRCRVCGLKIEYALRHPPYAV